MNFYFFFTLVNNKLILSVLFDESALDLNVITFLIKIIFCSLVCPLIEYGFIIRNLFTVQLLILTLKHRKECSTVKFFAVSLKPLLLIALNINTLQSNSHYINTIVFIFVYTFSSIRICACKCLVITFKSDG